MVTTVPLVTAPAAVEKEGRGHFVGENGHGNHLLGLKSARNARSLLVTPVVTWIVAPDAKNNGVGCRWVNPIGGVMNHVTRWWSGTLTETRLELK